MCHERAVRVPEAHRCGDGHAENFQRRALLAASYRSKARMRPRRVRRFTIGDGDDDDGDTTHQLMHDETAARQRFVVRMGHDHNCASCGELQGRCRLATNVVHRT